jgi:hypothetical protein
MLAEAANIREAQKQTATHFFAGANYEEAGRNNEEQMKESPSGKTIGRWSWRDNSGGRSLFANLNHDHRATPNNRGSYTHPQAEHSADET